MSGHKQGCNCAECRALRADAEDAGKGLFGLLGLHGYTSEAAQVVAWAIRNGVPEALPGGTDWAAGSNDPTVMHLVDDILS